MVIIVFFMLQGMIITLGFFQTFSIGSSKNIVSHHSFSESCITWQRLSQFNIFFAIFLYYFRLSPLSILSFHSLIEVITLTQCELVYFFTCLLDYGLNQNIFTSFTVILVFGTPTISAAVRCNL